EPAPLDEGRPLLELGRSSRNGNGLPLKALGRLDSGAAEAATCGGFGPYYSGDGPIIQAFRHPFATTTPVGEPNFGALAATSWAVFPDPLPGPTSTLRRTCS